MCATTDAAITLAKVSQLSEANSSAKSAIPFTINHSIWQSNAAVNTPVEQQNKGYMSFKTVLFITTLVIVPVM